MNKDGFIKKLEQELETLEEDKRKKVIKKYKDIIDKRTKENEKEEDVIASFGSVKLLGKNILIEHGTLTNKNQVEVNGFFGEFFAIIKGVMHHVRKKDFKVIIQLIVWVLLITLLVILLKTPFILGRNLIFSFYELTDTAASTTANLTYIAIEVGYIIFAIIVFIKLFNSKFKEYKKEN